MPAPLIEACIVLLHEWRAFSLALPQDHKGLKLSIIEANKESKGP